MSDDPILPQKNKAEQEIFLENRNTGQKATRKTYWKDYQRGLGLFNCPKCGKRLRWRYSLVICDPCKSAWHVNPETKKLF